MLDALLASIFMLCVDFREYPKYLVEMLGFETPRYWHICTRHTLRLAVKPGDAYVVLRVILTIDTKSI